MSHRIRREDCNVGCICTLPVEFVAARAILDEEHETDEDSYALGLIGDLRVAILRLQPSSGPAMHVASMLSTTYTGIRFLLKVGIGSGVPSPNIDIRLGDLVVSKPSLGIMQYESKDGGSRVTKERVLQQTPLRTIDHIIDQAYGNTLTKESFNSGSRTLAELILKTHQIAGLPRVERGDDILFEAKYDHEGGEACDWCNTDRQELRRSRRDECFKVFLGQIAVGKQGTMNGRTRDLLSAELGGTVCFAKDPYFALASLSSLTVLGICDYGDSHRNDRWQTYAAVTAVAFTKLFLLEIRSAELDKTKTKEDSLPSYFRMITSTPTKITIPKSTLFTKGQHVDISNPGTLPFRIIGQLGRGACAVVNMVEDISTGQIFAHKTFGTYYGKTAFERAKQSFQNEINIMKRLSFNPHIIEVFATYTCGRELGMLLLPVASEGSLADYLVRITESATVPTAEQQTVLRRSFGCLASGLAYIHKHTIRHKDIKPQNILIHYGRIVYADFGIALDASNQDTTTTGQPDGFTQRYCAPEVAEWGRRNRKSDIFSLGCVFVEVLAVLMSDPALGGGDSDPYWKRVGFLRNVLLRHSQPAYQNNLLRFGQSTSQRGQLFSICYKMLEPRQEDRMSAEALLENIGQMESLLVDTSYDFFCNTCGHKAIKMLPLQNAYLRPAELSLFGFMPQEAIRKTLFETFEHITSLQEMIWIFPAPRCPGYVGINRAQDVRSAIWSGSDMPTFVHEVCTPLADRALRLVYAELIDFHLAYQKFVTSSEDGSGMFRTTVEHVLKVANKYSRWLATMPYVRSSSDPNLWVLDSRVTEEDIQVLCQLVSP